MAIKIASSQVGSLHRLLGVKQGNKIPAAELATKSGDSPAMKKKKNFARVAKTWNHGPSSLRKLMGK